MSYFFIVNKNNNKNKIKKNTNKNMHAFLKNNNYSQIFKNFPIILYNQYNYKWNNLLQVSKFKKQSWVNNKDTHLNFSHAIMLSHKKKVSQSIDLLKKKIKTTKLIRQPFSMYFLQKNKYYLGNYEVMSNNRYLWLHSKNQTYNYINSLNFGWIKYRRP